MEYGVGSNKGSSRDCNEDAYYANESDAFFIVADGVGGAASGEVASNSAIAKAVEYLRQHPISKDAETLKVENYITNGIKEANKYVLKMAKSKPEYQGMGTTFILLYIQGESVYLANLGDSRAYLIREETITQITNDHTVSAELARRGEISFEDVATHPQNNVITKALGMDDEIEPDIHKLIIRENDIFVLCSDGVYNVLDNNELLSKFNNRGTIEKNCSEIIREIEKRQGKDDSTILAVKIKGGL